VIDKIVAQLKTGDIKNVIPYGTATGNNKPYIVVRPERDAVGRGTVYRIIVHMDPGQQIFLEDYLKDDVSDLLDGFGSETRHGNYNKLETLDEYNDIIVNNDDGTISMERSFLLPSKLF
jgi:hypothetical protein